MSTAPLQPTQPTPPAQTPPPMTPDPAKNEYERLIGMFKWLTGAVLTAITIVLGLAAAFLWKNTSDIQNQAAAAIKATQDTATQQISAIGIAAQDTAKSQAKKAIDDTLQKPNIQRLIQETARQQVDAAVEDAVQRNLGARIDAFRTLINKIGEIANHGAQLRLGFRPGLDALVKEMKNPDPTISAYARSTLMEIGADYERSEKAFNQRGLEDPNSYYWPTLTPKTLMVVIQHGQDPFGAQNAERAFLDMKKRVGWDVPMFDIPAAEKWCAAHKPKCDE